MALFAFLPDVKHILPIKTEVITGKHSEGQRTAGRSNVSALCLSQAPRRTGKLLQRAISPLRETTTPALAALKGKEYRYILILKKLRIKKFRAENKNSEYLIQWSHFIEVYPKSLNNQESIMS